MAAARRRPLPIALIAAVAIVAAFAGGATRPHRAAAADCNKIAFPYNLQPMIDAANPGDIICLTPDVFAGPVRIAGKRGLTLRGQGQQQTIIAGGAKDAMLIDNSSDITVEHLKLFFGHPSDAYVNNSANIIFQHVDAGGGAIGIHFDVNSTGRIADSFVYAIEGDAVLVRHGSNTTVERNWIFLNGGVGVSTVGKTATTTITQNIISDSKGPGVFAGQTPCSLLPPGFVEVPDCYLTNLQSFVGDANIILNANVIQSSGSTGIVMFPGTRATMNNNHIWRNHLSGLFAWGAHISSQGDEYAGNDEHAIEFRAYPDPLKYGQVGNSFPVRAVGSLNSNTIHDTVVLPQTRTLGGGVLAQGANLDVSNSRIYNNRGIGVSFVNTSLGAITGNMIYDNRGSAICEFHAGDITTARNTIFGNADNTVGVCDETTP